MRLFNKNKIFLILILMLAIILRLTWLEKIPPSLYTDEANQGYNAFSVLQTGRDEHGVLLPVSFRSFGDWKPPLPTYLMIPFIALFGLSEISVRLPSVMLGIGIIFITYLMVKELLENSFYAERIALIASFMLAISPWHILQSRSAMLVIVSLFFLEAGLYTFLRGLRKHNFVYLSGFCFALSIYAYYGMRVITPLVILSLLFLYRDKINNVLRQIILGAVLSIIILLPLISAFVRQPDVVLGRAKTVSVFYDQGVKLRQWELFSQDGINYPSFLARFFHNNLYMYGRNIAERFLTHFEGKYLFFEGDKAAPFQIPRMGIMYLPEGITIITGLYFLYRKQFHHRSLLISWLLISYIPAAFTFMTPSGNRTFSGVVPLMIFSAMGLVYMTKLVSYRIFLSIFISILYVVSFGYFLRQYFIALPHNYADWWSYGWKETVDYVYKNQDKYENIVASDVSGMPYIYFLFYNKYPPAKYQEEAVRTYVPDRFGYEHVSSFDKFIFLEDFNWKYIKENPSRKTLYLVPADQAHDDQNFLKEIYYPNGEAFIKIFGDI